MGKYMRKAKLTGDIVAVMDVSQSSLGVRTRARTLALQKLQAATPSPAPATEQSPELSYLQLRSRRLEKPPAQQLTCCRQQNPNPGKSSSRLVMNSGVSGSAGSGSVSEQTGDSFGENNIDLDGRESFIRESTPCSFIRDSSVSSTPGSTTRPTNLEAINQITRNSVQRIMPLAQEIEEFFARHDQEQQRRFAEKYNFDVVNEKAIEGRYEWVRV